MYYNAVLYHILYTMYHIPCTMYHLPCTIYVAVPTSVSETELCLNGMSFSRRDAPFANAALVVNIDKEDMVNTVPEEELTAEEVALLRGSPLVGMLWQRAFERRAARMGGGQCVAPVQRAPDFLRRHSPSPSSTSSASPSPPIRSSYRLGVRESPCHTIFPTFLTDTLCLALKEFDRKMPGFLCAGKHPLSSLFSPLLL